MPVRENAVNVYDFPSPKRGINLNKNIIDLSPEECLLTQNLVYQNGTKKRYGQNIFETDEVVASKAITGLHRFYYSTASKQLIASAGGSVRRHTGSTWTNIRTGLTDGATVHMTTWGGVQKMYYSNGTDGSLYSWDGTTDTALTGGNLPALVIQTLPYQDRLLAIDNTNPGTLTWSASFDDTPANWVAASSTGVKPDTQLFGMIHHSINNSDSGYEAGVLLAGSNGMYIFSGTNLATPATTGDYTIYPLATKVGCNSPRTMVWTPAGTMYLGMDRQVYLLPFKSSTPIPISTNLNSNTATEGLESIPSGQIQKACAVYHKGYYILSVTKSGGSNNTNQWWLDVTRLSVDEDGYYGPWYGPMVGQSISVFANQNGNGDSGELMAGEATAKGYVYEVNKNGQESDYDPANAATKAIDMEYRTFYHDLGNSVLNKDIHEIEMELKDLTGNVKIDFRDITGIKRTAINLQLTGGSITWGTKTWGSFNWSGVSPIRERIPLTPALQTRRLSMIVKFSSDAEIFELYALRSKATEQADIFAA